MTVITAQFISLLLLLLLQSQFSWLMLENTQLSCVVAVLLCATRNKGSESHTLKCCDFAGWDSKEQFTFITKELAAQQQHQDPSQENCPESPEQQVPGPAAVDREDGPLPEEKVADVLPGERLSVAVACHAK